jgi:hypothetical protein
MSNATQRYQCGRGTSFSCHGTSLDDQRPYAFRASLS